MKVIARLASFLVVAMLATAADSVAQVLSGPQGVVTTSAPVYLRPDTSRTPLRQLPANTIVYVQETRDDWVQVAFDDSQYGPRLGWMQRRFVSVRSSDSPAERPATTARPPVGATKDKVEGDRSSGGQTKKQPPRRPREPFALRGFGSFAFDQPSARESFEAVLGKDWIQSFGGGVQLTNLVGGLFAEASFEHTSDDGERVFVFGESVYKLGIPLRITQTPIDVAGGWRFTTGTRYTPYVGGGVTFMRYEETSDLSQPGDDVDVRETGYLAFAGLEVKAARWVHLRAEGRYRHIDNILGTGGVSAEFGETTLGGVGGSIKIVIGR